MSRAQLGPEIARCKVTGSYRDYDIIGGSMWLMNDPQTVLCMYTGADDEGWTIRRSDDGRYWYHNHRRAKTDVIGEIELTKAFINNLRAALAVL